MPIWLDPTQPFHYQFSLPSDRGEPYGLHIVVHDPFDFEWALQKVSDGLTTVFNTLGSAVAGSGVQLPLGLSFSLTAGLGFSLKVVEIDVITASISCTAGQCKAQAPTGDLFRRRPLAGRGHRRRQDLSAQPISRPPRHRRHGRYPQEAGRGHRPGQRSPSAPPPARRLTYDLVDPGSCVNRRRWIRPSNTWPTWASPPRIWATRSPSAARRCPSLCRAKARSVLYRPRRLVPGRADCRRCWPSSSRATRAATLRSMPSCRWSLAARPPSSSRRRPSSTRSSLSQAPRSTSSASTGFSTPRERARSCSPCSARPAPTRPAAAAAAPAGGGGGRRAPQPAAAQRLT